MRRNEPETRARRTRKAPAKANKSIAKTANRITCALPFVEATRPSRDKQTAPDRRSRDQKPRPPCRRPCWLRRAACFDRRSPAHVRQRHRIVPPASLTISVFRYPLNRTGRNDSVPGHKSADPSPARCRIQQRNTRARFRASDAACASEMSYPWVDLQAAP